MKTKITKLEYKKQDYPCIYEWEGMLAMATGPKGGVILHAPASATFCTGKVFGEKEGTTWESTNNWKLLKHPVRITFEN